MIQFFRHHLYLSLLLLLALAIVLPATVTFAQVLHAAGQGLLGVPVLLLFSVLLLWVALAFWTATFGFARRLWRLTRREPQAPNPAGELPPIAVVMPGHNEDTARVFASLQAIRDSLLATGHGRSFELFFLSDSTDPDLWLEEEAAWARYAESAGRDCPIFYRHRPRNTGHKSGNIADFCCRWGRRYTYMVVLDADSLMDGATLVEMARRMQADPKLGILQSQPLPINRCSLFARLQQFAAGVYGGLYAAGYSLWSGAAGNYWGHNAMIRTAAFLACCGLPRLPGKPPLGGDIMSHDFVEAALIRRAGWKVTLADDLTGSYEECPTNLIDFAKRDQRWCQGNLQHLRIMFAPGLHPLSRAHFGIGVMSYLASPLWMALILLGIIAGAAFLPGRDAAVTDPAALRLYAFTILLLLAPRLWAFLLLLAERRRLRKHGGALATAAGIAIETAFSVLITPVLMISQALCVIATLLGHTVRWDAQRRNEQDLSLGQAWRAHGLHTAVGLIAALAVLASHPEMLWWLSPVLIGAILAVPLSLALSSPEIGRRLREHGLLVVPEEVAPGPLLQKQQQYLVAAAEARSKLDPFTRVILDPALNSLHRANLRTTGGETGTPGQRRLCKVAIYGGPKRLRPSEKLALLSDTAAMHWLHETAWRRWPTHILDRASRRLVHSHT